MNSIKPNSVAKLRKSYPLTQEQCSEHLGINRQHLCHIETGRKRPSLALAERIADFFEVELDELGFGNLEKTPHDRHIPVRVNEATYKMLDAHRGEKSRSGYIRELLESHFAQMPTEEYVGSL